MSDCVVIERVGGIAGIGLPGSRIRSRAEIPADALSAHEAAAIDALFAGAAPRAPPTPDALRYRITRRSARGTQTIEVPEQDVPASIRARIVDRLE